MVEARPLAPAPTTFSASARSTPPMPPKRRAWSIIPAAASGSPASDATLPAPAASAYLLQGHNAGASALASALWTPTCVIFGVKRSASTPYVSAPHRLHPASAATRPARRPSRPDLHSLARAASRAARREALYGPHPPHHHRQERLLAPPHASPADVRPRLEIGSRPLQTSRAPDIDWRRGRLQADPGNLLNRAFVLPPAFALRAIDRRRRRRDGRFRRSRRLAQAPAVPNSPAGGSARTTAADAIRTS